MDANITATRTILDHDNLWVYLFAGRGNYNALADRNSNLEPYGITHTGENEKFDQPDGGDCVPVTVLMGASFGVKTGKLMLVNNILELKK